MVADAKKAFLDSAKLRVRPGLVRPIHGDGLRKLSRLVASRLSSRGAVGDICDTALVERGVEPAHV